MKQRAKQRGAAMIEAIVVAMVLLVFFGMIQWSGRAYAAKIDQAADTRRDVLYYASHNCEGDLPNAQDPETGAPDPTTGVDGTDTKKVTDTLENAGQMAPKRDWSLASTMKETDVEGSAIVGLQKSALKTHVKTTSWVACNEKRYDNEWTAVFSFAVDTVWHGGGFL